MRKIDYIKSIATLVLAFPVAAYILSVAAGLIVQQKPMIVLASMALLASVATVYSLDVIYKAMTSEKKGKLSLLLVLIFFLLAYPFRDISLYLVTQFGVYYPWIDEILYRYFYASFLLSGAVVNFALRI